MPTPTSKVRGLSPARQHGLTLIDLMTAGTVIMILTCIGIPQMRSWMQRSSELATLNLLSHVVALARTRAVRDQVYFTVCASDDRVHCTGKWNKTIIVFSDRNKDETVDNHDILYKAVSLPEGTDCIKWSAGLHRNYLQFKPTGASNGTAGNFRLCDSAHSLLKRKLVVSLTGRTSLKNL